MDIHTDTLLQVFITLSIWQLFEFVKTGKNKNFIFGFIAVGLAMLTKGPIGAAIPAFAVGGHILLKKDFRKLLDVRWLLGVVISFVVVSPAILGLSNQFGWEGIRFFFWENMAGRYTGTYVANAVNDPFFYIHNLLYLLLPWSLILFIAVFLEFKHLVQNKFNVAEFVTFTGIWIYFLIISSSESQLPNYVFPVIPLMAVLIAKWIVIVSEEYNLRWKIAFITQNIVVSLVWIAIFVFALYLFPRIKFYHWFVVLTGVVATIYVLMKSEVLWIKLVAPSAIAIISLFFLLNTHIFPYIFSFQAPPKAARYFTENSAETDKLYNYRYTQYELFFYSDPQALQLYSAEEMKVVASKKGNWIFTDKEGLEEIQKLDLNPEIIEYQHLFLNKGAKFILPEKRQSALFPMYLIHFQ
jgi:4-amino-4-deoxy-L-arabinose transferase-like glycosyltransferase